jgi:hypothetical protein
MTRGRKREKTYTGQNGAATDKLRAMQKLAHTPAGTAGRVAAPSQEAVRLHIEAQTCPWCSAGPFKILATHTHRAHGVDRHELRELAGLLKGARICAPEISAACADRRAGVRLPDIAYERIAGTKRQFSEAGKAVQRAKLEPTRATAQPKAARAIGDKTLAANAQKYAAILERYNAGDSTVEIADSLKFRPSFVRACLKREGVWIDGRKRRWQSVEA